MHKTQGSILENSLMLGGEEKVWKIDKLWDHSGGDATSPLLRLTSGGEKASTVAQEPSSIWFIHSLHYSLLCTYSTWLETKSQNAFYLPYHYYQELVKYPSWTWHSAECLYTHGINRLELSKGLYKTLRYTPSITIIFRFICFSYKALTSLSDSSTHLAGCNQCFHPLSPGLITEHHSWQNLRIHVMGKGLE